MANSTDRPSLTWLGKTVIALFVTGCIAGAYWLAQRRHVLPAALNAGNVLTGNGRNVEFGIAYGTEKQKWLEAAVEQFKSTTRASTFRWTSSPWVRWKARTLPRRG